MQRKKWTKAFGLTAAFGFVFASGVYAQDAIQKVEAYLRPDYQIVLNGKPVNLQHSTLIYDGSSYLPLKEIGTLFGATVNWRGETNTIYINSRLSDLQPETSDNVQYPEVTMMGAYGMVLDYLGAKTWVLQMYAGSSEKYYRLDDVKRMGVMTDGLSKVRDKYTGWLFVSEKELKKTWKATPKTSYDPSWTHPYMSTESDPNKLDAMEKYVKLWSNFQIGNQYYSVSPIVIDPLPDKTDEYRMLASVNGHYYFFELKLTKSSLFEDDYLVSTANTYNLETGKQEDPYSPPR
ncbi:hypothetical protein SD70_09175 [Gordoniibacillus kamchatkensis]|uniref:Copper amine oxidase-like N-terminal domain-containing protein n=2 Tax=Gordoniibacillus kamchatkensis TaxID=1590651 RepID=A0ABR5AJL4_9BACL|nr:hypothetical protein SD70_09175 [Paenibacillus sp. VKM B-2647]